MRPIENRPLSEAAGRPLVWLPASAAAADALARIRAEHVSSVVVLNEQGGLAGIVTERSLLLDLAEWRGTVAGFGARSLATLVRPAVTADMESSLWQGLALFAREGCRHLVLMDEAGMPRRVVTPRDLLGTPVRDFFGLIRTVEEAPHEEELRRAMEEAQLLLERLAGEGAGYLDRGELAAEIYDRIAARILDQAVRAMSERHPAFTPPPFAWLQLGSGGRREQVFPNDQDSALIYVPDGEGPEEGGKALREQMLRLAETAVARLEAVGFQRCAGGLMASHPALNRSRGEWAAALEGWARTPSPDAVRMVSILLDLRPAYGDARAAAGLRTAVVGKLSETPALLGALVRDSLQMSLPMEVFRSRRLPRTQRSAAVRVKEQALQPLIACIRVMALLAGVEETSTRGRLFALVRSGGLPEVSAWQAVHAYETLKLLPDPARIESLQPSQRLALHEQLLVIRELRDRLARSAPAV